VRTWDLTGGAAKLQMAMKSLQEASAEVAETWDDPAFRAIEDNYLRPVEPQLKVLLEALGRLQEVLVNASRDCN